MCIIKTSHAQKGFSLVELSIVLIITGILFTGFMKSYSLWLQEQQYKLTKQRLQDIRTALTVYVTTHEALPCPAGPPGSVSSNDRCAPGARPPSNIMVYDPNPLAGDAGQQTWIGTLPVHELRLDNEQGEDGWGNEFTYAVSRRLTYPHGMRGNPLPVGGISVGDETGTNVLDQPGTGRYVVVSHGPTGAGAWTTQGGRIPCQKDTLDGANCNGGNIFVVAPFSTKPGKTFYDDIVIHDDPNSGGTLLDRLAICNLKMAFYLPAVPGSDQDGCRGRTNVWEGACLQSYGVNNMGEQVPVGPAVAVMAPAQVTENTCGCSMGYTLITAGTWNDNSGVDGNEFVTPDGKTIFRSRTTLYTCVQ